MICPECKKKLTDADAYGYDLTKHQQRCAPMYKIEVQGLGNVCETAETKKKREGVIV